MYNRIKKGVWASMLIFSMLTACAIQSETVSTNQTLVNVNEDEPVVSAASATTDSAAVVVNEGSTQSVAEVAAENSASHDDAEDYVIDSTSVTQIMLAGDTIAVDGAGVTVNGRIATITQAGTYQLSGTLTEGQIVVDTEDETAVTLILNGINISHLSTSPIYIANTDETIIVLAEGSENYVTDGAGYVFAGADEDEDTTLGYITIENGIITINSGGDAIQAVTDVLIFGGTFNLTSGGGSNASPAADASAKGIKATVNITVDGGTIIVNAAGDGIDVNGAIEMTDGVVIVNGLTEQINGALAYDGTFTMTGGFFVAAGSARMAQTADASSTQNALLLNLNGTLALLSQVPSPQLAASVDPNSANLDKKSSTAKGVQLTCG